MYRKGTILLRKRINIPNDSRCHTIVIPLYEDVIQPKFWERHLELLAMKPGNVYEWPEDSPLPKLVISQLNLGVKSKNSGETDQVNLEDKPITNNEEQQQMR